MADPFLKPSIYGLVEDALHDFCRKADALGDTDAVSDALNAHGLVDFIEAWEDYLGG